MLVGASAALPETVMSFVPASEAAPAESPAEAKVNAAIENVALPSLVALLQRLVRI